MKILVSWSSGKDSAWMLHVLKQDEAVEIGFGDDLIPRF